MRHRIEMVVGTLEFAGKTEQLAEEQTPAGVGWVISYLIDCGSDRVFQLAGTKQVAGTHGSWSSFNAVYDRIDNALEIVETLSVSEPHSPSDRGADNPAPGCG